MRLFGRSEQCQENPSSLVLATATARGCAARTAREKHYNGDLCSPSSNPLLGTPLALFRMLASASFALLLVVVSFIPAFAFQEKVDWQIVNPAIQTAVPSDVYLVGWNVDVSSKIQGDLFILGGRVRVRGPVHGNVFLAGGSVEIDGPVDGDINLVGFSAAARSDCRTSRILALSAEQRGTVRRDALSFGLLSRSYGDVAGDTLLGGENTELQGTHQGKFYAYSHHLVVLGTIQGNSQIRSDTITLGRNALLAGNLTYSSSTDLSSVRKQIQGETVRQFSSFFHFPREFQLPWVYNLTHRIFSAVWLVLVGMVILTWFPRSVRTVVDAMLHFPWESFGLGLLLFFALPTLAFLLIVSLLGMPIGIFLFMLFGIGVYLTRLFGSLYIGERLLGALEHHVPPYWQSLPLGVFLFTVLTSIPWVGILVSVVVIPLALGAKALLGRRIYRRMRYRHLA